MFRAAVLEISRREPAVGRYGGTEGRRRPALVLPVTLGRPAVGVLALAPAAALEENTAVCRRASPAPCATTSHPEPEWPSWGHLHTKVGFARELVVSPLPAPGLQTSGAGAVSLGTEDTSVPGAVADTTVFP